MVQLACLLHQPGPGPGHGRGRGGAAGPCSCTERAPLSADAPGSSLPHCAPALVPSPDRSPLPATQPPLDALTLRSAPKLPPLLAPAAPSPLGTMLSRPRDGRGHRGTALSPAGPKLLSPLRALTASQGQGPRTPALIARLCRCRGRDGAGFRSLPSDRSQVQHALSSHLSVTSCPLAPGLSTKAPGPQPASRPACP